MTFHYYCTHTHTTTTIRCCSNLSFLFVEHIQCIWLNNVWCSSFPLFRKPFETMLALWCLTLPFAMTLAAHTMCHIPLRHSINRPWLFLLTIRFSHWCTAIYFPPFGMCPRFVCVDYTVTHFRAPYKSLIPVCLPKIVFVLEHFTLWLICSATRGSFVKLKLRSLLLPVQND